MKNVYLRAVIIITGMSGYLVLYRNRETSGIVMDALDDIPLEHRIIYCQAVADVESARADLNDVEFSVADDVNDQIAALVEALQCIANAYPLQGFSRPS